MHMPSSNVQIKAQLLEEGKIFIPNEIVMPCFASRSTVGPDAGSSSFVFEFKGSRVKLEVTKDPGARFQLSTHPDDVSFTILEREKELIRHVKVLPTLAHAPNQAFVNLSSRCIFGCRFCSTSVKEMELGGEMNPERVLRIVNIASGHPGFEAVAITSGIPDSPTETNHRIVEVIKALREHYPDVPIGVETIFEDMEEIQAIKNAGADEIKINMEIWPEKLFKQMCPLRNRKNIFNALEKAVDVFGRGKVTSNIIIGFGEGDAEVEEGVRALAERDVVVNLRRLIINKFNEEMARETLGKIPEKVKADRLIDLATMQKNVLEEHDLSTLSFKTMCLSCECCDIVPMRDL